MASRAPGQKSLFADRTKTPGNDFYHDIDPCGDLILEVGDPATSIRIRASSKALSLASPVFAAMFSPRFAEGKPVSSGEYRNITLPDDDPCAMITLCNAVHLKSSRVSVASFDAVERLSILCDKYDCAEALSPWSRQWLSKWQGSMYGQDGYLKMIYVSYGFNDHDSFWNATANVLKCYDAVTMTSVRSNHRGFAILPDQLLDELDVQRKTLLQEIYKAIESAIDPFLKESNARIVSHGFPQGSMTFEPPQRDAAPTHVLSFGSISSPGSIGSTRSAQRSPFSSFSRRDTTPTHELSFGTISGTQHSAFGQRLPAAPTHDASFGGSRSGSLLSQYPSAAVPTQRWDSSCSSGMKIGLLFLELSRLDLWPLSDKVMTSNVQDVLKKVARFKGVGEPASGCQCRTCKIGFKDVMTGLAATQLGRVKGLCLGCVRAGRVMPEGGNCQGRGECVCVVAEV